MRRTGFPPEVREQIQARAMGLCERCGYGASDVAIHHRRARGMGSTRRDDTNLASNGAWLCGECHRHVESYRTQAYADGWLVHQQQSPLEVPVLRRGTWVVLDDDGNYRRFCRETA